MLLKTLVSVINTQTQVIIPLAIQYNFTFYTHSICIVTIMWQTFHWIQMIPKSCWLLCTIRSFFNLSIQIIICKPLLILPKLERTLCSVCWLDGSMCVVHTCMQVLINLWWILYLLQHITLEARHILTEHHNPTSDWQTVKLRISFSHECVAQHTNTFLYTYSMKN